MKATIKLNKENVIGKIDDRLYGSFIEHLGRAVYGGIYEPGHKTADDMGFRKDVLELIDELHVPIVRYPGGNFVSGYNWEDGTGPKELRPKKMELAWNSTETNEIGIDEFQEWAKRANTDIMMAVNLGTRGADEARNLVEYCNSTTDTFYANKRRENGFEEPFGIKVWCLGNEMDGPWQICAKTPVEYARLATEASKVMKMVDDSIETVACGSSMASMKTFGEWELTVLREAYDTIDYLSLHSYFGNGSEDTRRYLAQSMDMDDFIKKVIGFCDQVKEEKKSDKTINLSFDEWNVWFHSNEQDKEIPKWQVAPPLLEDIYNFEDALVVGCLMNTLINNSDRIKMACLAQLVNVIAPIMTKTGGCVWKQTIFFPFGYASGYGRGTALKAVIDCDTYDCDDRKAIPYIDMAAVISEDEKQVSLFVINRSLDESEELNIEMTGLDGFKLSEHVALESNDLKAVNTEDNPSQIAPVRKAVSGDTVTLSPASWNMLVFNK